MRTMDTTEIMKYDSEGMLDRVLQFPQQMQHALSLSRERPLNWPSGRIANVCLAGMGGSGISGDLVRSYLADSLKVPFYVNRSYSLPEFVDERTLLVISSYSGNTEETLSSYEEGLARNAQIVCITSGGTVLEKAQSSGHPVFTIPTGFHPRAALGYLTVPLLFTLFYAKLIVQPETDLQETIGLLDRLSKEYHPDRQENLPHKISAGLFGKIPLIYAAVPNFEAVVWRWKGQLSENSKVLAFANLFPELNHNEIMGWGPLTEINRHFQVVYLKDREYHPQNQKRMAITKEILEKHTPPVLEVESRGESLLARIFSLIYLGDMVSVYLAALNKVDPTPIENIALLKQKINLIVS
ncbi:MAG: bifunctional phosphoglucose/phosphomannose isomerase [bacterium]